MLWFTMDGSTKPIYIENRHTGDLYQMLDVIRSEENDAVALDLESENNSQKEEQ